MASPYNIINNTISLRNHQLHKGGYYITLGLMYFTGALPVLVLTILLATGSAPSIGFLIVSAAFGFITYFFYRLATWNKHGVEHFSVQDNLLIYRPEAKKISFKIHELPLDTTKLTLQKISDTTVYNGIECALAKIVFHTNDQQFENNIKTPIDALRDILNQLEHWGVHVEMDYEELHD